MAHRFRSACLPIALILALSTPAAAESIYTSIEEKDCGTPPRLITSAYGDDDVTVQQCPSIKGWSLYVVSSDERSWLDLTNGSTIWSTERPVVHDNDFGYFPNIGGKVAEWVFEGGKPLSLIFRISAQDPKAAVGAGKVRKISRLFVVSLRGKEPTLCGTATTNEKARALAASSGRCKISLPRRPSQSHK